MIRRSALVTVLAVLGLLGNMSAAGASTLPTGERTLH
jgi:hypothetical protein